MVYFFFFLKEALQLIPELMDSFKYSVSLLHISMPSVSVSADEHCRSSPVCTVGQEGL